MQTKNQDIKNFILKNNLKFWQIAEKLNINDGNFSRLLRKELTNEKKDEIFKIVNQLKNNNN